MYADIRKHKVVSIVAVLNSLRILSMKIEKEV